MLIYILLKGRFGAACWVSLRKEAVLEESWLFPKAAVRVGSGAEAELLQHFSAWLRF